MELLCFLAIRKLGEAPAMASWASVGGSWAKG